MANNVAFKANLTLVATVDNPAGAGNNVSFSVTRPFDVYNVTANITTQGTQAATTYTVLKGASTIATTVATDATPTTSTVAGMATLVDANRSVATTDTLNVQDSVGDALFKLYIDVIPTAV